MHPKITFTLKIEFLISKDKFSKQRPSTGVTLDDVYIHLKNSENEWWLKPGQEMLSMWPVVLYARWRKTLQFSKAVYWSTKDKLSCFYCFIVQSYPGRNSRYLQKPLWNRSQTKWSSERQRKKNIQLLSDTQTLTHTEHWNIPTSMYTYRLRTDIFIWNKRSSPPSY